MNNFINNDTNENSPKKTNKKIVKKIIIVIIVFTIFFGIVKCNSVSNFNSNSNSSSYSYSDRKIDAWVCMQDIVSSKLKNPSSAKYPSYSSSYVTSLGSDKYKIRAYVDATNSFNAQIRTWFTCTLTLTGQGYKNGSVVFD